MKTIEVKTAREAKKILKNVVAKKVNGVEYIGIEASNRYVTGYSVEQQTTRVIDPPFIIEY